ncbi:MAG: amino-acid N-acetyltransferase [Gammaproteobacteria bacterium]|nr:MAG: amino-acid N-acetyltransferase [Gammaproteobacteria bacterium]
MSRGPGRREPRAPDPAQRAFVARFRDATPYIQAFRGRTFVVAFGGEAVADPAFPALARDLALLHSLGVRLVLVHGTRPQIEERLRQRGAELRVVEGLRVTDEAALACVKEAAGAVRVDVEALLSMSHHGGSPVRLPGARPAPLRVASGNFVVAKPLGVRGGVDFQHTGEVRRIDAEAIRRLLDEGALVLLPPLGYSPTGEVFNLTAPEVATATAAALQADKLLCLVEAPGVPGARRHLLRHLSLEEAQARLEGRPPLEGELRTWLEAALAACRQGVRRAHLVDRRLDGALLLELFTRDGVGTLISTDVYEGTRRATVEDVPGILDLIAPLEEAGILVPRSRERLELEIDRFTVVDRDGRIIACAALFPFPRQRAAEIACLAVHPDYRRAGYGSALLARLEEEARGQGLARTFVLTTRGAHWFQERGYRPAGVEALPVARRRLYNWRRGSKVYVKTLD